MKKLITALALGALFATAAHAQPGRVTIGAGVGFRNYVDNKFSGTSTAIVPEYHLGFGERSDRNGLRWGLKGGIIYSHPDFSDFVAGSETSIGSLQVVSAMGGFGPSYRNGPFAIGLGVVAGPSFNKFTIDDAARDAYSTRLDATLNSVKVKNSLAVRSGVSAWYNLTHRLGVHSTVSYTANRPTVETTIDGVTTQSKWKMDRWSYQMGLGIGLF